MWLAVECEEEWAEAMPCCTQACEARKSFGGAGEGRSQCHGCTLGSFGLRQGGMRGARSVGSRGSSSECSGSFCAVLGTDEHSLGESDGGGTGEN